MSKEATDERVDKKTVIGWIKKHKKELLIIGISIAGLIAVILGMNNKNELEEKYSLLKESVKKSSGCIFKEDFASESKEVLIPADLEEPQNNLEIGKKLLSRCSHLRKLPIGHKASAEKIATAKENGFDDLEKGYTWVKAVGEEIKAA